MPHQFSFLTTLKIKTRPNKIGATSCRSIFVQEFIMCFCFRCSLSYDRSEKSGESVLAERRINFS